MSTKGSQPVAAGPVAAGPVPAVASAGPAPAGPTPAAPAPSPWRRAQRSVGNRELSARLHTDADAAALARSLGAKAVTRGRDIFFGQGRFAPETHEGGKLLRHELTHVAQNDNAARSGGRPSPVAELEREARAVGEGRKARVEGKAGAGMLLRDPEGSGTPVATTANPGQLRLNFYQSANPLAPYTVLRQAAPTEWQALATTAASQTLDARLNADPNAAPAASGTVEVQVPLTGLVRPELPPFIMEDLRGRLWPLVSEEFGDQDEAAAVIRDEIVNRWAAANTDLLASMVTVRLIPPEDAPAPPMAMGPQGLVIGPQSVLTFEIDGEPIESADGSMQLLLLDMLGSDNLETIVQEVGDEASTIAMAGDLLRGSKQLVSAETEFWDRVRNEPDSVARNEVEAHYGLFSIRMGADGPAEAPLGMQLAFFLQVHPEFSSEFGEVGPQLSELAGWVREDYQGYRDYFQSLVESGELSTAREGLDSTWEGAASAWEEGVAGGALGYSMAGLGEGLYWVGNTVTFGYPDTRHAGAQAVKRGDISFNQFQELSDAAAARGAAVALVGVALTLATAGLAGPVLGTSASLGSKMLFYGVAGGFSAVATETTGHAITTQGSFADPTSQEIWNRGRRTPGQVAMAGAMGFGLGAASVPAGIVLGKLVQWVRGKPPVPPPTGTALVPAGESALATGSESALATEGAAVVVMPRPTAPSGWVAEQVTDDIIRFTRPDLPGEVIVTPTSMRYQTPTGTGMRVEFEIPLSGQRPAGSAPGLVPPAGAAGELPAGAAHPQLPAPAQTPALPAPPVRPALPAQAGGSTNSVWVNPGSRVFHRPGSRWYGNTKGGVFMTEQQALAQGYQPAGQPPPSGVISVTRPAVGDHRIVVRAKLGPRQNRRGYEKQMASASEYGLQQLAGMERGHTTGAGIGAEAAEAIRLETRQVNQVLKRQGVERTMKDLVATLQPGDELYLTTATHTHPGTLRLKMVEYKLEIVRAGGRPETVFVASIEQGLSGRATWDVELVGEIAEGLMTPAPLPVRRSAASNAAVPPAALARAGSDSSPGRPLPRALGHEAARHFQLRADGVRIHDDPRAHRLAADIDAYAFTRGSDIYFGAGRYAPATRQGRVLLGHELAHVAQQRGGAARSAGTRLEPAGSSLERQAERAGEGFAAGHQAPVLAAAAPALFRFEGTSTTADDLIDRYTSWGDLDEDGLGAKLVDLCWMSERHYPIVDQVMDSLWDFNEDDVARGFAAATSDVVADQFASTEAGRKMLRRLISEMADGMTWGEDSKLAIHLYSAIARREGADKGKERGLAVLEKAAAAPAKATAVRGAEVLSIPELQERMRLLGTILERLERRYATDPDLLVALAVARERLAAKRTGLSVDNAPELSLYLTEGQMVAERVEEVLLNLDLQLAGYRTNSALAVQNEGLIAVTDRVRTGYLDALVTLLLPGNIAAFERAERVAAQLPRALTEAQLAQIEFRRPGFSLIEGSHQQLVAWIGVVRSELDQLETDARALRDARERQADDVKEREGRFAAGREKLELSLEAIGEWEKVLRAYEYLASGFNLIYTAYGSIGTLQERVTAMRDAAYGNNLELLRQRVEEHRNDPNVATFYKNMPLFISASQMLVSLGITLVAAIATAGVGGAVAGSLGTAATTGGRILTFVGTAAVEAVTFTAVSRSLQSVAPGQRPQGSALGELAWNFGLFLLLRGVSAGITKGLEARGLEILATPLNLTASGTLLQGYGILRFRLEQGRFPSSDEIAKMTVENLIMLIGITLATRSVTRAFEAHDAYKTLQSFEHKYAWRFEALEVGRQGLLNKIRTALDQGQGADPKVLAELQEAGKLVEGEYAKLIEEIKADRSTPIEVAREELLAIDFAPGAASQELLTQSLGLPEAVRLRNAGTLDQYTYEWGQTGSLEDGLVGLGATVVKTADPGTGLRTLSATFADRAPLTFAERASYFPMKGEVEIDPTDAALRALLTDFGIADPAAQRFVVRLLSVELSKNPAHGTTSAAKPVRKQLKLYEAAAKTEAKTTEQKLLEVRTQGLVGGKVDATVKAAADTLEASGILSSPEWLAARDPGNFRGTVTEWLAIEDITSRQLPAEILLRNIHFKGDLYTDPTLTTPLLDGQTGRPLRGVDAGSELDFLTVVETGATFEYQTLYNAKGYASGGNAAAARQNVQSLDLLRAAEAGTPVEITLNSGEKATSEVKEIWGIDTRTNAEIELTGRLTEAPAGATQETIGLKQKGSTHTQQLPYDTKQIDQIVNLLRERQLISSPDY